MQKVNFPALVIFCSLALQACKDSDSETKIIKGRQIDASTHPAVVMLKSGNGNCTGTFVSHNTLVTAGHCLQDENGRALTRAQIRFNNIAAIKLFPNPQFNSRSFTADSAIILFPNNTAPGTLPISLEEPKVGDTATLVGYGLDEYGRVGNKKEGTTTISNINDSRIVSKRTTSSMSSAARGDSGGPMIINNKIVGVASLADEKTMTIHSKLAAAIHLDFLKSTLAQGAAIAGLSPEGGASTASSSQDIFLALEDSANPDIATIHISTKEEVQAVAVCLGISAADCQNDLSKAKIFNARSVRNGRSFFKTIESAALSANQLISAVALDQNSKPLRGVGVKVTQ